MAVRTRVRLESGRLLNSAGNAEEAVVEFEDAAALARSGGLLFLEIDALHMLAIADRARFRERAAEAIDRALAAPDDRTRRWLVSLYNNLGCSYSETGDLDQAMAAFVQAQEWAERAGTGQQQVWAREAVEECAAARQARARCADDECAGAGEDQMSAPPEHHDPAAAPQYDSIGEEYDKVKSTLYARNSERFTFLRAIGKVQGKSVLDLACGTGFYTRMLREEGARRVVGVDVSAVMIDIARGRESAAPAGIEYHVADVSTMPLIGKFDLVASAYLLNYAPDEATLRQMCQKIADSLEADGTFAYLGANPLFAFDKPNMTKYGATIEYVRSIPGGAQTEVTIHVDPPIKFDSYNLDVGIYERAFQDAGLSDIEWIPLAVPPEAVDRYGAGFWDDLTDNPGLIALRASRKS